MAFFFVLCISTYTYDNVLCSKASRQCRGRIWCPAFDAITVAIVGASTAACHDTTHDGCLVFCFLILFWA